MTTETIGEWYLSESGGDPAGFRDRLLHGQGYGQAFFNSLTPADQERLRGTSHDPFHFGVGRIRAAVEFLTGGVS